MLKNLHIFVQLRYILFHILVVFQKCLTLMDRGYVFRLIKSYMEQFSAEDSRTLFDYKLTFLQIICSHEHYVAFNLPLQRITKSRANGVLCILVTLFSFLHDLFGQLIN